MSYMALKVRSLTIRLDDETHSALVEMAEAEDVSVGTVARRALRSGLGLGSPKLQGVAAVASAPKGNKYIPPKPRPAVAKSLTYTEQLKAARGEKL